MKELSTVGIDLAKTIIQVCGLSKSGKVLFNKALKRQQLLAFLGQLPRVRVMFEACAGSHYWAREIEALGHSVKMIHPKYVKPFVQVQKTDARDAVAIAEAGTRDHIPSVAPKSIEQQELQCLHRVRERAVRSRTALGNELRSLLLEFGVVVGRGYGTLRRQIPTLLEDATNGLGLKTRQLIDDLWRQWLTYCERIAQYDRDLKQLAAQYEPCRRLQTIPGIGPVNATLLYAQIGDPKAYRSGRHFAASLGLTPKQHSSGGKEVMRGISKQGNKQARCQLVHGARSAHSALLKSTKDSRLRDWLLRMGDKHTNVQVVALANKLARISWAVMAKQTEFAA